MIVVGVIASSRVSSASDVLASGAITVPKQTTAGSGVLSETFLANGAISIPKQDAAGGGVLLPSFIGSGAVTIPKQEAAGTGSFGAAADPYWANVQLLSGFEGADGSITFTDEGPDGRALSRWGTTAPTAEIDTSQFKFGVSSIYFPGGEKWIRAATASDFNIASSEDFTIESWVRAQTLSGSFFRTLWGRYVSAGEYTLWIRNTPNSFLYFAVNGGKNLQGSTIIATNTWYHVAVCRSGDTLRIFLDGAINAEATGWGSQVMTLANLFNIGGNSIVNDAYVGWQDEFRFTKGVARYTGAFSAPTEAFPRG